MKKVNPPPLWRWGQRGNPFPCRKPSCRSPHPLSRHSVKSRPVFPLRHLPSDPSSTPGGPFSSPEVEMDPPPGALRESPGVSALRSALERGKPVRAGLCSQDTFVPGDAQPVRYVEARAAGFPCLWRGVWGPGRWLRRGPAGRRTSGGRRELSDPLPGCLLRSIAGQSNLAPHPKHVWLRHRAGAAARPLRRCSAAQPSASGSVYTKAAPEAPARPLTRHPQAD